MDFPLSICILSSAVDGIDLVLIWVVVGANDGITEEECTEAESIKSWTVEFGTREFWTVEFGTEEFETGESWTVEFGTG
eukprot:7220580-Ditylum_brightwellii.AAC.1